MAASEFTRESLIRALKEYAARTTGRISMERFCGAVGTSPPVIRRHFPGEYQEFLDAAGLNSRYARVKRVDRGVLMREIDRVATALGGVPTREDVERHGRIRPDTFRRKIGCWKNVVGEYQRWKSARRETCPRVRDGRKSGGTGRAGRAAPGPRDSLALQPIIVGAPLGFRGLLHAPVNELGVVHLFGVLGPEVGLAVEHIGAAYPDCRALRKEPGEHGRWRRIAVEFELRSSNFRAHGHDPALCDLIVCWEHDWAECPVEVMELRSVLRGVRERG